MRVPLAHAVTIRLPEPDGKKLKELKDHREVWFSRTVGSELAALDWTSVARKYLHRIARWHCLQWLAR